ncbi:glutathione S-transferase family protein [Thalassospira australica]|uniref:glutathione S-transferase family protein n=1 Tax=Thalassospira australica TaxID=1528106 RepID=UPI00384B76E0
MKIYYNAPSPYARKVVVSARELGLADRISWIATNPWSEESNLRKINPLSRIPALVTENGRMLCESTAICQFLADHRDAQNGDRISGSTEKFDIMARTGLAQGLIDAGFGIVIEERRPENLQSTDWKDRLRHAIDSTLAHLDTPPAGRFDLGDITLACALAYFDFRLSFISWRAEYPNLSAWLDTVSIRPSMQASRPENG